jgi:hypothetical protein
VEATEAGSLMNGELYNFDSLNAAPRHLSKSSLAAYLDSLKSSGWSIFAVRENILEEFPISLSESSNRFGKWLSPEDVERINKSCNSGHQAPQEIIVERQQHSKQFVSDEEDEMFFDMEYEMFSDMEDEDLEAAIAASLMDSAPDEASALNSSGAKSITLAAIGAFMSSSSMSKNMSYSMYENISSSSSERARLECCCLSTTLSSGACCTDLQDLFNLSASSGESHYPKGSEDSDKEIRNSSRKFPLTTNMLHAKPFKELR